MLHDDAVVKSMTNEELIDEYAFWIGRFWDKDTAYLVLPEDLTMLKNEILKRMI